MELLIEPTALIIGAGASSDYGFPSWEKLKECLKDRFEQDAFRELCAGALAPPDEIEKACDWWIEQLLADPDLTVDNIAHRGPDPTYDLFRAATSLILVELERIDDKSEGWTERFASKLLETLTAKLSDSDAFRNAIGNLRVISLNYDRVFDVRFSKSFVDQLRSRIEVDQKKRIWKKYEQHAKNIQAVGRCRRFVHWKVAFHDRNGKLNIVALQRTPKVGRKLTCHRNLSLIPPRTRKHASRGCGRDRVTDRKRESFY